MRDPFCSPDEMRGKHDSHAGLSLMWAWDMVKRCAGTPVDRNGMVRGDARMGAACGGGSMTGCHGTLREIGGVYPF